MKIILPLFMLAFLLNTPFDEPQKPVTHIVEMVGMKFTPKTIEIKVGDKR